MARPVVTSAPSGQARSGSTAAEGFEGLDSWAEVPAGAGLERARIGAACRVPCDVSEIWSGQKAVAKNSNLLFKCSRFLPSLAYPVPASVPKGANDLAQIVVELPSGLHIADNLLVLIIGIVQHLQRRLPFL